MQIKTSLQVLTLQRETDKVVSFFLCFSDRLQQTPTPNLWARGEEQLHVALSYWFHNFVIGIGHGQAAKNSLSSKFCPLPWWFSHDDDCCCLQRGRFELCRFVWVSSSLSPSRHLVNFFGKSYCFILMSIYRGSWFILDTCMRCWWNEQDSERKVCWTLRDTNTRECKVSLSISSSNLI
jgi:hypothetical protein